MKKSAMKTTHLLSDFETQNIRHLVSCCAYRNSVSSGNSIATRFARLCFRDESKRCTQLLVEMKSVLLQRVLDGFERAVSRIGVGRRCGDTRYRAFEPIKDAL